MTISKAPRAFPPIGASNLMESCEFRDSPVHGYGVFATEDINPGTLIVQEEALWVVDTMTAIRGTFSTSLDYSEARNAMLKAWAMMNRTAESAEHLNRDFHDVLSLYDGTNGNGRSTRRLPKDRKDTVQTTSEQLREILILNGVPETCEGPAGHATVFRCCSRLNHSCAPNAERTLWTISNGATWAQVITTTPIKKDQEIFIDYMGPFAPYQWRRQMLRERWRFTCKCRQCSRPKKEIEASDDRRDRLEAACVRINNCVKNRSQPRLAHQSLEYYNHYLDECDRNILGPFGWEEVEKLASKEGVNDFRLWHTLLAVSDAAQRLKKLQLEGKVIDRLLVANKFFHIGAFNREYLLDRKNKITVALTTIAALAGIQAKKK